MEVIIQSVVLFHHCQDHGWKLTPDNEDEMGDCAGVVDIPNDVGALVLLLHVIQHQVVQSVDINLLVLAVHLTRLHQIHLSGVVGPGLEQNLCDVLRRDVDVNVLAEEGCPVFLCHWRNQSFQIKFSFLLSL